MSNDARQYGDLATQLLLESRRSTQTDTLLKYNDPLVRALVREQRELEKVATALLAAEDAARGPPAPALFLVQTAINRNKRCLLAYHAHRTARLRDLFWACGGALPHLLSSSGSGSTVAASSSSSGTGSGTGNAGGDLRGRMSPHEVDYLRSYASSLMDYRAEFAYELDIMSGVARPPKEMHIRVRVVRECGVVQTESGSIDFRRGERYVVCRADVESLVVQGYLEEV